ncbi:MAG TPA: DUF3618 domain-containing protein [Streptosporangiaceae bacterium]|jgi:hypothetical protein
MTSPEELQDDIERTRDQLGETVEALVAKADVKARAQRKVADVKAEAVHKAADVKAGAQQKGADAAEHVAAQAKNLADRLPDQVTDKRSGGLIVAGVAMLAAAWLIVRRVRRS